MADCLTIYLHGAGAYSFDKRGGLARMQFACVQRMDTVSASLDRHRRSATSS